jgi:hypothetical protein
MRHDHVSSCQAILVMGAGLMCQYGDVFSEAIEISSNNPHVPIGLVNLADSYQAFPHQRIVFQTQMDNGQFSNHHDR